MNTDIRWQVWCRRRRSRDPWTKTGGICRTKAEAINYISDTELKSGVPLDLEWRVVPEGEIPSIEPEKDRYRHRMMRPQQ